MSPMNLCHWQAAGKRMGELKMPAIRLFIFFHVNGTLLLKVQATVKKWFAQDSGAEEGFDPDDSAGPCSG